MTLTVRLTRTGNALHGPLEGHPGHLEVRVIPRSPTHATIALWRRGEAQDAIMGSGELNVVDGTWRGECSELKAVWQVRGAVGSGALEFGESKDG